METLKAKLAEVNAWKTRLTDIDAELHFKA